MALNIAQMQAGVPSAFDQAIGGFQIGTQMRQQREAEQQAKLQAEQQAARQAQMQEALGRLYSKPNAGFSDYAQVGAQFPELMEEMRKGFELFDEEKQKAVSGQLAGVVSALESGNVDIAQKQLEQQLEAAKESGDQRMIDGLSMNIELIKADPEAAKKSLGMMGLAILGEDSLQKVLENAVGGTVQERELQLKPVQLKDGSQAFVAWDEQANEFFEPGTDRRYAPGEVAPIPAKGQTINVGGDKLPSAVKALEEADASRITASLSEAAEGVKQNEQLYMLEDLIDSGMVDTGALEGRLVGLKSFADDLGFKVDQEKLGNQEFLRATTNEMALRLRNPDSGLGLTGNTSDKDVEFLKETVPGLLRSEQGNKVMVKVAIARNERKREVADLMREYVRKNETLDGFDEYKDSWLEANPMFTAEDKRELFGLVESRESTSSAEIDSLIEKYAD